MQPGKDIRELFPIFAIENDCILSQQGDVTVAWKVELPEIFTLSEADYRALHQVWVKAVRLLPRQTVLHKQDWFTTAGYEAEFTGECSFLSRASEHFFHERPYLAHRCYLLVTRKPARRRAASSLASSLLRRSLVPPETLSAACLQEFLDAMGQFARILTDSGFLGLQRLQNDELAGTASQAGLIERYLHLNWEEQRVFLNDISFTDGIQVGAHRCQLFTLADAPDLPARCSWKTDYEPYSTEKTKLSIGFASPLGLLLPCNHLYNQYLFVDDPQKAISRLEAKRLRLQSLSLYSRENALARDATSEFLNEAIAQQRLPVKAHFNILAWSDDPAEAREIRNLVSSALARMDATPKQEVEGAPQIHWAGIPGNAAEFPMNDCFDTFAEQACCFFNLETNYQSSLSPVGLRLGDRLSGRPVHVDLSDEPMRKGVITNRNKFILGPSGSGKSFFTNHMVRSYYEQGTHIVLVDVGHSYKGLCELVQGYYFTYSESRPIAFNPFHLETALDTEKKESIKTLLLALWKKDNEPFRRSEYVALSNALQHYYEKERGFRCFNSFYEFLQQEFAEILRQEGVKDRDFDIANFLYVLRPYYRGGEFDYLLNATENLDLLQERFIVFELDNIKDHPILFPIVTIIIMEVFITKMRKLKGVRKMILIEEAWKAIAREGMAEYIKYLFKTVRKFFGEAVVVTQEVDDIISSPVVKQAIIHNSDCKILLDQSKYQNKFDQIQELLGLSDKEKAMVLSINRANDPARRYKEVFISLGGMLSRVYRTEVSPEEYLAYTTEEKEKLKLQQYAERFGGDLKKAIRAMAAEMRAPGKGV